MTIEPWRSASPTYVGLAASVHVQWACAMWPCTIVVGRPLTPLIWQSASHVFARQKFHFTNNSLWHMCWSRPIISFLFTLEWIVRMCSPFLVTSYVCTSDSRDTASQCRQTQLYSRIFVQCSDDHDVKSHSNIISMIQCLDNRLRSFW